MISISVFRIWRCLLRYLHWHLREYLLGWSGQGILSVALWRYSHLADMCERTSFGSTKHFGLVLGFESPVVGGSKALAGNNIAHGTFVKWTGHGQHMPRDKDYE